ncbi:helix-turn-helix domain-containing protein [Streptomyces sp. NPDC102462]|uniref:helix-turn-helix domain-containing protein n=1 Tax=Streptomyces sp. NPDC102462 TaxID=3366178 RepID=UPI00381B3C79
MRSVNGCTDASAEVSELAEGHCEFVAKPFVLLVQFAVGVPQRSYKKGRLFGVTRRQFRCELVGAGCRPWYVRYADGGGRTAEGLQRRESVRTEAAELFAQEVKPPEVAQRLRVSRKPAYQWHRMWKDAGSAALASRGPSGQRNKLSPYGPGVLAQTPAAM